MNLTIDSICLISTIIDKAEIDDKFISEMAEMGKTATGKDSKTVESIKTQIGMKMMLKLGSKIHLVKDEITEFISKYKEISIEEAKKINVIDVIKELMADKDLMGFLKQKATSK